MAVFAWVAGDPFSYEMDETPFYDAVSDVPSDVFHAAADLRSSGQTMTFGWGVSYTKWVGQFMQDYDPDQDPRNKPLNALLAIGIPLSFMPFGLMTVSPYFLPWTAPVAFALDAYNIYRYFDE